MLHDSHSVRRCRGREEEIRWEQRRWYRRGIGGREGWERMRVGYRQVDLGCCNCDRAVSPWLWNVRGEQTGLGIIKHQNKEGKRRREKRKRQSVTDRLWAWVSGRSVWRLKIGLNHTSALPRHTLHTRQQSEGFTAWRQTGKLINWLWMLL